MPWVLLAVLLAMFAVGLLALLTLGLWRKVKALSREVGRAGEAVGRATEALAVVQRRRPDVG